MAFLASIVFIAYVTGLFLGKTSKELKSFTVRWSLYAVGSLFCLSLMFFMLDLFGSRF